MRLPFPLEPYPEAGPEAVSSAPAPNRRRSSSKSPPSCTGTWKHFQIRGPSPPSPALESASSTVLWSPHDNRPPYWNWPGRAPGRSAGLAAQIPASGPAGYETKGRCPAPSGWTRQTDRPV